MLLKQDKKLLFIGDSVTDCDRAKPHGEGLFQALGNGYVSIVDAFLQSSYPELGIRVVNKGISGNTVRDLKERWTEDVIEQNPDWVSIMIGINDVWRQYDSPLMKEIHVYIDEYKETLTQLVETTKSSAENIILMTPFYIEPNKSDAMRHTMDQYGAEVKKIAEEHGCIFVNTQEAFNEVMKSLYPANIAWDRVHPNTTGHTVLAKAFLRAVEFDWHR
ncbi:Lysophospholipase L1 [Gracilibacillus ureilyticus]|uniref:Lysophospholipase L1 n=1 Tax=Gracilibacillus ureilyticus TaxID=531814 RepID=A0A1H9PTS9_9BACI|nr:SGNH/GDSL hydrolase family protein [Gracilibacillus ureilyticus]SER51696.1 Lysophospholipase L1 [Gracilibacillus ureilyticus]